MNFKGILIGGIIILAFISAVVFMDLSMGTKTALIVGVLLLFLIDLQYKILSHKIYSLALFIDEQNKIKESEKSLSYQINLTISPDWNAILSHCANELDLKVDSFRDNILKNEKFKINFKESLYLRGFSFVYFYDSVSGMYQIWSDYYKTFSPDLEVRGQTFDGGDELLFRGDDILPEKIRDSKIFNSIIINASEIGFHTDSYVDEVIQEFPFHSVVDFLIELKKNTGCSMPKIKLFPQSIIKKFKKYGIKYEGFVDEDYCLDKEVSQKLIESDWLRSNGVELYAKSVDYHTFSSKFMSISMVINFFEKN